MCVGDAENFFSNPKKWTKAHENQVKGAVTGGLVGGPAGAATGATAGAAQDSLEHAVQRALGPLEGQAAELARQASQAPDLQAYRRNTRRDRQATLLTSPSGIDLSAMSLGRSSLMGR
ncbi:MAG: hypothetical protein RLZZ524_462 [Pseudomonadota bacterium]